MAVSVRAVELDDSPVADCEFKSKFTLTKDVPTVRVRDFMGMCDDFVRSQRAMPPISVMISLGKVATLINARDSALDERKIAYQLIAIIEARSVKTPAQMNSTLDIAFKAHRATGGLVAPKDLNVALRSMGTRATGIADTDFLALATMIWNKKREAGE